MPLLKTILFTLLVPGSVTVLIPYWLLGRRWPKPVGIYSYLGIIPLLLGAIFYLWCAWDFAAAGKGTPAPIDPPKDLVVRGLFRYVRNPMYVGIISIVLGEALLFDSGVLLEYAGICFLLMTFFVLLYEEPALTKKFGESYEQYCSNVPRFIPRIPR
ncbi:MAG: isoprenylcysteine carboxylmethyltransferase family protein [Acidobacteriia bacterium]|nr:isoprenylcysteine carboxylmethyltransferase family protein [Terriglobia bacterium]